MVFVVWWRLQISETVPVARFNISKFTSRRIFDHLFIKYLSKMGWAGTSLSPCTLSKLLIFDNNILIINWCTNKINIRCHRSVKDRCVKQSKVDTYIHDTWNNLKSSNCCSFHHLTESGPLELNIVGMLLHIEALDLNYILLDWSRRLRLK